MNGGLAHDTTPELYDVWSFMLQYTDLWWMMDFTEELRTREIAVQELSRTLLQLFFNRSFVGISSDLETEAI